MMKDEGKTHAKSEPQDEHQCQLSSVSNFRYILFFILFYFIKNNIKIEIWRTEWIYVIMRMQLRYFFIVPEILFFSDFRYQKRITIMQNCFILLSQ